MEEEKQKKRYCIFCNKDKQPNYVYITQLCKYNKSAQIHVFVISVLTDIEIYRFQPSKQLVEKNLFFNGEICAITY